MSSAARYAWYQQFAASVVGKLWLALYANDFKSLRSYEFTPDEGGRIQMHDVAAGRYMLTYFQGPGPNYAAVLMRDVIVPPIPGDVSDVPLDLGDLRLDALPPASQPAR